MTVFKPNETMLQNYIQNKLSPKDTEQLELWLADHPEVMHDLELDMMFSQAKYDLDEAPQPKQAKSFYLLDFLSNRKLVPINLLAYGLALLFVFNTLLNNNTKDNYSPATFVELEKQRGVDQNILEIKHDVKSGMAIRFFPDSLSDTYKVILIQNDTKHQIVINQLKPDENDSITVMLDSNAELTHMWQVKIYNSTNKLEQNYTIKFK